MFKQIELSYGFGALEPHIDKLTMITHYSKHHATYTANLNAAVEKVPELSGKSIEEILKNLDVIADTTLRTAIRNNGGGFYNHNLYFSTISPNGGGNPRGELEKKIKEDFGSVEDMRMHLSAAAISRFGSGWAWLSTDKDGKLNVSSSPNQDNPLIEDSSFIPILGIDVWEHAYYLKYKNLRPDYVKAFWNVVDWNAVSRLYDYVIAG
ncbi:superoxide dismutase [Acidilutibacter cellobiosedens]|jgi:Fe-Mn family superoxide dismutase|uniref:Superoxide dismutase n=1 Tax=Acidilutibacter cellobiosedens TaxID=2507161 RepID=A0A410Q8T8_9FIRM|nr:superoxide dismutase [Acidilutibacter cellobiosedens]QAT60381.1 superoxide dismutase [Acidilutibacter cellobiosedens]